jgi:hypothetical protein
MNKIVYDAETGQTTTVPFSQKDLDLVEQIEAQREIDIENNIYPQSQNNLLKESAINKLKELGLTEEEAKALAGI